MNQNTDYDLVVVGAGMVGLALALGVARTGLRVALLEQRPGDPADWLKAVAERGSNEYENRVSALNLASVQLLKNLGAWDAITGSGRACDYTDMYVWDGEGSGSIHFSADALHEDCLGYIVENAVIHAGLLQALQQHEHLELMTGTRVRALSAPAAAGQRELELEDGRLLQARLVVAADGALSQIRKLAGIPATEWDYGHHALVTSVWTEQSHAHCCWQRFTEGGPLAFLPLSSTEANVSSIVWSTSPAHGRDLMALSDSEFLTALGRAFENRLGEVTACTERQLIPLRQRHAHRYVEPGLALIGDAAHTIHPLAGQGVNLGFMDAAALVDVLCRAEARSESIADLAVLRRFQRQRRSSNLGMAATMEGFRRLFAPQPAPVRMLRSCGMNLMDRLELVKQHLVLQAMGLSGEQPPLARRPRV